MMLQEQKLSGYVSEGKDMGKTLTQAKEKANAMKTDVRTSMNS